MSSVNVGKKLIVIREIVFNEVVVFIINSHSLMEFFLFNFIILGMGKQEKRDIATNFVKKTVYLDLMEILSGKNFTREEKEQNSLSLYLRKR